MSYQNEELRLALVMNGGVSLAVWMGGVSNEIFRVVTQQHPVYTELLKMTHTTARVDVISGTSAGGVNGAAMSLALLYGGDFSRLRDVWLKTGAFSSLLRAPLGDDPSSLLQGDEFFLPQIVKAFDKLAQEPRPVMSAAAMPIDLRLTTTLLRGEQGHSVDDLGIALHDVDYRGQFRFRHATDKSDFEDRKPLIDALGRAARSTASFPFAFEPSAVKGPGAQLFDAMDRPIKASKVDNQVVPRYVIDGGILNNKPFRGALRSVFAMPAQRGVRRVLAYINPDPGDGPPGKPVKEAPQLSSVLGASLFGIPQSQTIADQLAEIQAHNDHVRTRRGSVVNTVVSLPAHVLGELARGLFKLYRMRRLIDTFDGFVFDELPAAARRLDQPAAGVLGKRGRARLQQTFLQVHWNRWIPEDWPVGWPDDPLKPCEDKEWEWGLYPVEFAIKIVLDLLRRTQQLTDFDPAQGGASASAPKVDVAFDPSIVLPPDWNDPPRRPAKSDEASSSASQMLSSGWQGVMSTLGLGSVELKTWDQDVVRNAASVDPTPHPWLREAWEAAYLAVDGAESIRAGERKIWENNANELLTRLTSVGADHRTGVDAIDPKDFEGWFAFLVTEARRESCGQLIRRVAKVVLQLSDHATALARLVLAEQVEQSEQGEQKPAAAEEQRARKMPRPHNRAAARDLLHFLQWLTPQGAKTPICSVIGRLMQLEVIEHAHAEHEELEDDCLIELVQISGNSSSPLGGPSQATDKLLGLQLAHFGAFYKQSWRANDWTYGRLDGSERLVKILMNPERLQRFFSSSTEAYQRIKAIALDDILSPVLRTEVAMLWMSRKYEPQLRRELAFLDDSLAGVPDALPVCSEVVTLRLHFGILREEIDPLLTAISADRAEGADSLGQSEAFFQRFVRHKGPTGTTILPYSPEQARQALEGGLIAGETLLGEAGSDLFTRTLAHTTATLQGVLSSKTAKLGPVSLFFAALKLPILGFYFVARGLTRQSRTSAALHGAALAIGLALVCAQFILHGQEKPAALPPSVHIFGWAMLAYGLLFSVASSPRVVAPLLLIVTGLLGWHLRHTPLGIQIGAGLVILGALALSVRYRSLSVLQWVIGIAAILGAALWSIGWQGPPFPDLDNQVIQMALLTCAVVVLASWQASAWSRRAEGFIRRLLGLL